MLGATLALGYAWLSHRLMTGAGNEVLALLVVLGPLAGFGLAGVWAGGQRVLALAGVVLLVMLAGLAQRGNGLPTQWLYLAQHAGIHLGLALWFGSTLRRGRQPLISALAERVHGDLIPAMASYTRRVTLSWVVYFAAMTVTSIGLFAAADFEVWSVLANLLTPVSAVAMFVGEYLLRYRLHPEFERVAFLEAVRAYRLHQTERSRGA